MSRSARRLLLGLTACALGAACAAGPVRAVEAPAAVAAPTAPPTGAPSHAPPTCPLPGPSGAPVDDTATAADPPDGASRRAAPLHGDTCETADSNLRRVEAAILAAAAKPRPGTTRTVPATPWDHVRPPARQALVARRLALRPSEQKTLTENGFVVLERQTFRSFARAFHEIYQSQLPVYVSVDALLHAVYAGNDGLVADLEDTRLAPKLAAVLDAIACGLTSAAASYTPETRHDLDVYVSVARSLLRGEAPVSMFGDAGVEAEAAKLVAAAIAAGEMASVDLFGRRRVIDFTAYTPRGHYAETPARQQFFRAGMWLSRLEFNLVSRSSRSSEPGNVPNPAETPREAVDALALADLVERAGQSAALAELDTAWALLAGRREDVSVTQLAALRKQADIQSLTDPDIAGKLRAAIGDGFQRTARLHYMPQGSKTLPAIATLLGPRVVPDAAATRPLVDAETPDRTVLHAADLGYVLGSDRALAHLSADRAKYPTLDAQLATARHILETAPRGADDLYSAWLTAIAGLNRPVDGARPSFTVTPAYADLRLNSTLAAFGQLKHTFVLVAGESYFEGGCEIPDGYVEPAPATYAALADFAVRGERALAVLDPADTVGGRAWFRQLGTIVQVLTAIQTDELAGRALSDDERAFLSMVAEMAPGYTGSAPTYTGWYFDLFRRREADGLAGADYIASFFTGESIAYLGATAPRLGVFVIDTGGPPRLVVGPVARAYEYQGPVARRLDDAAGAALPEAARVSPWAASYTVAAPPAPRLHVSWSTGGDASDIVLESPDALGPAVVEPYDHHRVALETHRLALKAGETHVRPSRAARRRAEGVHVHVSEFDAWIDVNAAEEGLSADFGMPPIPPE